MSEQEKGIHITEVMDDLNQAEQMSARIRGPRSGAQGCDRDTEELAGVSGAARHPPSRPRAAGGGPRRQRGVEGREGARKDDSGGELKGGGGLTYPPQVWSDLEEQEESR